MSKTYGHFPFGQPNTERPMRAAKTHAAKAIVIGVYPSAWHVDWHAPKHLVEPGRRGRVAALAVDVEPTVFWDGSADDYQARVQEWKSSTGFVEGDEPGCHGTLGHKPPAANGSSGKKVEDRYLAALGVHQHETAFTDIYPVFHVKYGAGARREQGDAISAEYNTIASSLGRPPASLPPRPSPGQLVNTAVSTFSKRIIADLEAADADIVLSLGDEVFKTLAQIPGLDPRPPVERFSDLYGDERYGAEGALTLNGRRVTWVPVVHPGLLKGKPEPDDVPHTGAPRRATGWNTLHARWERRMAGTSS